MDGLSPALNCAYAAHCIGTFLSGPASMRCFRLTLFYALCAQSPYKSRWRSQIYHGQKESVIGTRDIPIDRHKASLYDGLMAKKRQNKPGPKEDRLKLEGPWEEAVKKLVRKEKPEGGWPDQGEKPKRK